jgi:hypothetical protein
MRTATSLFITALLLAFGATHLDSAAQSSVAYCSLIAARESYDGKQIRVHGTYRVAGREVSEFSSSSCEDGKSLWVEFRPAFQSCSSSKAVEQLEEMKRKSGVKWARPHVSVVTAVYRSSEVEFVGTFSSNNPFTQTPDFKDDGPLSPLLMNRQRADFVFTVSWIEKLKPLPRNAVR